MDPITLFIWLILLILALIVAWYFLKRTDLPEPIPVVILLLIILVFALYLLRGKLF